MEVDRISVIIFVTAGLDRKHIVLKCLKRGKHKVNLLICSTRANITDEQSRDDGLIEERYADDLTGKVQPGRTLAALDHCCVGHCGPGAWPVARTRSEEHTSELQSLMRISYAVFCLKKKRNNKTRRQFINQNT